MTRLFSLLLLAVGGCSDAQEPAPLSPPPCGCPGVVSVAPDGRVIHPGDTLHMSVMVIAPEDFGSATVTWDVSDDKIASVSSDGIVRALGIGAFAVRATLVNERGHGAQGVASVIVE